MKFPPQNTSSLSGMRPKREDGKSYSYFKAATGTSEAARMAG